MLLHRLTPAAEAHCHVHNYQIFDLVAAVVDRVKYHTQLGTLLAEGVDVPVQLVVDNKPPKLLIDLQPPFPLLQVRWPVDEVH